MSRSIQFLIEEKVCGGAVRRALLHALAGFSDDDGERIFASIGTIAKRSEIGVSTLRRHMKDLISEGLLEQTGNTVACKNGETNEYRLNLGALNELQDIKDPYQSGRGVKEKPVPNTDTPTGVEPVPNDGTPTRESGDPYQNGTQTKSNNPSVSSSGSCVRGRSTPRCWLDRLCEATHLTFDATKNSTLMMSWKSLGQRWVDSDWDLELDCVPVIAELTKHKSHFEIQSWAYFEVAIARHHANRMKPVPVAEADHDSTSTHRTGAQIINGPGGRRERSNILGNLQAELDGQRVGAG